MRKIFFITCFLPFLAFGQNNDSYIINGKIKGAGNTTVYLYKSGRFGVGNSDLLIDSIETQNDTFILKGKIDVPQLYSIKIKGSKDYRKFVVSAGNITIEGDTSMFWKSKVRAGNQEVAFEQMQSLRNKFHKTMNSWVDSTFKYLELDTNRALDYERKYLNVERAYLGEALEFITKHNDYYASLYLLSDFTNKNSNPDTLKKYFNLLSDRFKNSSDGQNLLYKISHRKFTNTRASNFNMVDILGKATSTLPQNGKLLLLYFSATWCVPCTQELPKFKNTFEIYKNSLDIITISLDRDLATWKEFAKNHQLKWPSICDEKGSAGALASYFIVNAIPRKILINPAGLIIYDSTESKQDLEGFLSDYKFTVSTNRKK